MERSVADEPTDQVVDPVVTRVQALVELAARHQLEELLVEAEDFRLRVRTRSGGKVEAPRLSGPPAVETPPPAAEPAHDITAPMIGTLYLASGPDEPPFVAVGETVEAGQTVAIIEAMKIMNEIQSDQRGVLIEVLARNGQGVEFGQALFRLRPL